MASDSEPETEGAPSGVLVIDVASDSDSELPAALARAPVLVIDVGSEAEAEAEAEAAVAVARAPSPEATGPVRGAAPALDTRGVSSQRARRAILDETRFVDTTYTVRGPLASVLISAGLTLLAGLGPGPEQARLPCGCRQRQRG